MLPALPLCPTANPAPPIVLAQAVSITRLPLMAQAAFPAPSLWLTVASAPLRLLA